MHFGLSLLPDLGHDDGPASEYFRDYIDLSCWAERNGFGWVKMTEHYLNAYGGFCPSPLAFLAAVAARTSRIRLMTGCVIPVLHHPVELASVTSMVDAISDGRLDVGFARGYMPYEFSTFGVPMADSTSMFTRSVEAVIRLWTETGVTFDAGRHSAQNATILPRPTQSPHPPVWGAAVRTPESFARIGASGFGLLASPSGLSEDADNIARYRQAFAESEAGQSGASPRVAMSIPLYIGKTYADAIAVADPHLNRYLDIWASAAAVDIDVVSTDYANYVGMSAFLRDLTAKEFRLSSSAFVGDSQQVTAKIEELRRTIDPDIILWQVDFGGMPAAEAQRSLERFVGDVQPALLTSSAPEVTVV